MNLIVAEIIGLILFFTGPTYIIFKLVQTANVKRAYKSEQSAYENMIISPSDTTVSQYISAFQGSTTYKIKSYGVEDRIRQAQGYKEISENTNVSEELKEQLKTLLILKGVPIEV